MATTTDDVLNQIGVYVRNPATVVKNALGLLETLTDGNVVPVDASNPFVYSLEMSAINSANVMLQSDTNTRRQFPAMAQSQEDLYFHMADEDYLDRFAQPATTTIGFVMPMADVLGKAVAVNDGSGTRALIIPRHTAVTIGSYVFTLQYPVVIKVRQNGNLSIYLDTTTTTPTYTPTTNSLNWVTTNIENVSWMLLEVPVQQVKITSVSQQIMSFTGFSHTFVFSDNFYYARAYIPKSTGGWTEISVVHQSEIYNASTPTVCLTVLNSSVNIYIPQIYYQNGLITDTVRLDIYTTQGNLNVDLTDVTTTTTQINWRDLDYGLSAFSTPFNSFTSISCIPRQKLTGGRAALSFSELLSRVTNRSRESEGLPITNVELPNVLADSSFSLMTKMDNITGMQFAASRQVDPPADDSTVTGLGCSIQTAKVSLDDLEINTTLYNDTQRATITPRHLFKRGDSGIEILSSSDRDSLNSIATTAPEQIASIVNATQYYYTPFHYVLDMSSREFSVRPFYLTAPTIVNHNLVQQNDGLGLDLQTDTYALTYNTDGSGYTFVVNLKYNDSLQVFNANQIGVQLSYLVPETSKRGYITGTLMTPIDPTTQKPQNNVWAYQFTIPTNFDIDTTNQLDNPVNNCPFGLSQQFDLCIVVKDYAPSGAVSTDIDKIIALSGLSGYNAQSTYFGATQERVNITFGQSLDRLWKRSRTIQASPTYQTYASDVYAYYTKDIYEKDSNGGDKLYLDKSGNVQFNRLHAKGDPILDTNGNPVILNAKGSVVKDSFGDPIVDNSDTGLVRQIDLFFIDGGYYFATNEVTTDYLASSLDTITGWITDDIATLQARVIGETQLWFYPKASIGHVDVIVGEGQMVQLPAGQTFGVTYTLSKANNNNAELKEQLIKNTPSILMSALTALETTSDGALTKNDLIYVIKKLMGSDIYDVDVTGFLNDQYSAVLLTDVSAVPTIGKRLVALSNLTLQVQDAVDVSFKELSTNNLNPFTMKNTS